VTGDSSVPRPDAARPRGRIRARLRIGRVDLVAALDVLIAFIVFAADNAWLLSQKQAHDGRRDDLLLLLVAAASGRRSRSTSGSAVMIRSWSSRRSTSTITSTRRCAPEPAGSC
jgi:hypothetical protein